MQILGNIFYIIIFISAIGGLFSFMALFLKYVFHASLPLWFGAFGIIFYLVPVTVSQVQLIADEEQSWYQGFYMASYIWLVGAVMFTIYFIGRTVMAACAVKKFALCQDDRILCILHECCSMLHVKRVPQIFYADLKTSFCVFTVMKPIILINSSIAEQLTERELCIILGHELAHIKRGHHLLQRVYDIVSILNWFNPFVWISKSDFELICEMDCDKYILSALGIPTKDYAATMLKLMELSAKRTNHAMGSLGALGFLLAKQRVRAILIQPTKMHKTIAMMFFVLLIIGLLFISGLASRTFFYPYPALDSAPEHSAGDST